MLPCPDGTYFDGLSAISVNDCKKCPLGKYCGGDGEGSIECDPGTFSNKIGATQCQSCTEGYFCPLGTTNPLICTTGTISSKGSSACTPCPSGYYTDGEGQTFCKACLGSQMNIQGWYCMTALERLLFIFLWIGSLGSAYKAYKKIKEIISERIKTLKQQNIPVTVMNIIRFNKIIKKDIQLSNINDSTPILSEDRQEINQLKEIITSIKGEIDSLRINYKKLIVFKVIFKVIIYELF